MDLPATNRVWSVEEKLINLICEFVFLLFLLTWFYRRTGKVYLGAIVVSSLVSWFLSVGGALAP